jgi:Tol biopolymer transport system component
VPASGGRPVAVTELDLSASEFTHRYPFFLPDGNHFLFLTRRGIGGENGVSVGSLDGMTPKRILDVDSQAVYVEPGYVLYWRDGAVRVHRFALETLDVVGEPFLIIPQTRFEPAENTAHFSASNNGVIVYHQGEGATAKSELLLHDRTGAVIGRVGQPGNFYSPRFSNDGQFVAVDNSGVQNNGDIWIYGVDSPVAIRLTSDPADESRPIWSPDDKRIAFSSSAGGLNNTFIKTIANPAQHEVLRQELTEHEFADWAAPDGRVSFHRSVEGEQGGPQDLWLHSTQTGEAEAFLESPSHTAFARFLPDTDWFAYVSEETGQPEIYLQSLSHPASKRRISIGGGVNPHWRRDGLEIFYISLAGMIMSIQFENGPEGEASMPTPLFDANTRFEPEQFSLDYDVSADGQTFLVNSPIDQDFPAPMSLLLHWSPEDARR